MTDVQGSPRKDTAAQRVERIKREKASWSIMDDIRRYAKEGFASIPADDLGVRFRAWGLYTQGDGHGTRGEEQPYFMMRVRTPNGLLTSEMVRTIADLSDRYARSSIDITNRQNFQLHWLRIEDVPTVWDELARVGWTSMGACGDNTRTVTGCPLAGVEHDELIDASSIALEVDRFLNGNPEYANFPRKFKITITGCAHWCTYPEINDIGATAVRRADGVVGFHLRVGGGLSTRPHLAVDAAGIRAAGSVAARGRSGGEHLPRFGRAAREPREGAHEIPVHQPWMDCRVLPGGGGETHRIRARARGGGATARGLVSRSRGCPPSEATRPSLCRVFRRLGTH